MDGSAIKKWILEPRQVIKWAAQGVAMAGRRSTLKELAVLRGRVSLQEAARLLDRSPVRKSKPPPKPLQVKKQREPPKKPGVSIHGTAGTEYLRKRAVYAKARVFLEILRRQKIVVSLWDVMRRAEAKKPWEYSGDISLIMEAAQDAGVKKFVKDKCVYFK